MIQKHTLLSNNRDSYYGITVYFINKNYVIDILSIFYILEIKYLIRKSQTLLK